METKSYVFNNGIPEILQTKKTFCYIKYRIISIFDPSPPPPPPPA